MEDSFKMLIENPPDVVRDAAELLLKCIGNILRDPHNSKYRKIRIAKVANRLLPVAGAIECLFSVGFEEDGEFFTMPQSASLDNLRKLHSLLSEKYSANTPSEPSTEPKSQTISVVEQNKSSVLHPSQYIDHQSEAAFYTQVVSHVQKVRNYIRPGVLEKTRRCMPLNAMMKAASESSQDGSDVNDQLLVELLAWFKDSFFHWMDAPLCSSCNNPTLSCGHTPPTPDELAHQASRVENYKCTMAQCGTFTRFPRYNDPLRLLETRVGRCGEWANCFTLCCLAAGLEARLVVDWTDHVWTEVFSTGRNRWIHADPCENVCDKPLLYEVGWGKKLTYVIGFSPDDIQDVTWRYTQSPADVLSRRTLCREGWLVHVLIDLRQQLQTWRQKQNAMTSERCNLLTRRTLEELLEFICGRQSDSAGLGGRTTGSLEWRRARGELGQDARDVGHVISPTTDEINNMMLEIKYTCTEDKYFRGSTVNNSWKSLLFKAESIFRKVEHDWKMVYLARLEGTDVGRLSWKFDLTGSGLCVDRLEVKVFDYCVGAGQVQWLVCSNDECVAIKSGELQQVKLSCCNVFELKAVLTGGSGDVAWQHAQLFRQQLTDRFYPFEICVFMRRQN